MNAVIAIREARVHHAALAAGSFEIAFATTLLDVADPLALLDDLTTEAPANYPRWHEPEFDRLHAAAVSANSVQQWRLLDAAGRDG